MPSILFSTFALGEFSTSAIFCGVASLVIFALTAVIAGPNLEKFDTEA
tara:strand:+ start:27554 stop:27697 length:144 start_codon:yes stop_codon:yes gene_type:complete